MATRAKNIATSQGRHHDAIRHFSRAAGAAGRVHDVLLLARVHENWANPLHALGRFDEALEQEARAIGLAEVAGFAFLHALALRDRAATNLGLGRLDEAVADAEAATAIYRSIDSGWVCVSLAALGDVYRERGEIELARAAYEESLGAESSGEAPILIIVRSGLARVLALEEPQRAADLARRATVQGPAPETVEGLLAAGWIALAHGDHAAAGLRAQEASAAARRRDERPGLAEALELRALSAAEPSHELASLHEAAALWRKLGNPVAEARTEYALARIVDARHDAERAKRKLGRLGVRVESAGQAAGLLMALGAEPDAPLRIQTLGAFRIVRDGQPAPMSEWQSKKARRLLKTLVARRGRPVPRDVLMDALWPDDDSAAVAKRLSVAVSTIRAVLDPTGRYEPDHFVGGSDALALDYAHVDVDVEDFLSDAARGVEALREGRHGEALELLEAAEAAYSGEFLEEELYEDWAAPLREEARAAYISVARALAIESAKARDHDATVRYRLRLLQRDPYDEDAHLGVVSALIESRRHGDARRAYGVYVTRMEEISLEPAPYPIVDRP